MPFLAMSRRLGVTLALVVFLAGVLMLTAQRASIVAADAPASSDATCDSIDDDLDGAIDEDCVISNPTNIGASQLVNANINGQGTDAFVSPGSTLSVSGNTYLTPSPYCPGCVRQLYISVAPNPTSGTPSQGSVCFNSATSRSYSTTFTAPSVDGVYYVLGRVNLDYYCYGGYWGGTPVAQFTIDTTEPVLSLPSNIRATQTSPSGAEVSFTASALDNIEGSLPVSCTPGSGSTFPMGTTTVDCSASDSRGNTAHDSFSVTVTDAPPILAVGGTASFVEDGSPVIVAPGLTLTDPGNEPLTAARVSITTNFNAAQDRLGMQGQSGTSGTVDGLGWSYNTSTGVLALSGSAAPSVYQSVLRKVTYLNNSQDPNASPRTVNFAIGSSLFFEGTGHFYEFVSASGITWTAARDAAVARNYFGLQGYLVTVTSAPENSFVAGKLQGYGWLGASDTTAEGVWKWVTGPEAGTQFSSQFKTGSCSANTAPALPGQYANWSGGEPNDCGGYPANHYEDYGHFLTNGTWNDFPNYVGSIAGYVVEYGGMPGDPVLSLNGSATVNVQPVNDPPTVNANGPYTVAEGGSVTLAGSGSDIEGQPLSYTWDLNNDGVFETAGQAAAFSAAALDGPSTRTVVVRGTEQPTLFWDFQNASSAGSVSTSQGLSSGSNMLTGYASQTGGGPAETWGGNILHLTRFLGTYYPYVQFTTTVQTTLQSISFLHIHNHNPGFPTYPSYQVQLQINTGGGFADIGAPVMLSGATSGTTANVSLGGLALGPGTYQIRWVPRNLAYGSDTNTEFFAMDDLTLSLTGQSATDSATVTVNNVAPTITSVTNNGPINEGSSATITVAASDPAGANDPLAYSFDCNNDSTYEVGPQTGNSAVCSFADNGAFVVGVRVADGDGGVATSSTTVTVNNVAPSLTVNVGAANTAYYVDWTAANPGAGTASGVINLPNGSTVNVTLQALTPSGTPSFFYGAQTSGGTNYWVPSTPYISAEVPNAPPSSDLLQLSGGNNTIYKVTLSQPIVDPIMAIVSLGSPGNTITYNFDSPFTIVSQGVGYFGGCSTCLAQLSGNILRGTEGHGTIKFLGTYSTFSWTVPNPEVWHGFTFAIRTTESMGNINVQEGQTATNSGTWADPGANDNVALSASVGAVVKNPGGTWTWSFNTNDGPAQSQTVTITATDKDGASTSTTFPLVVNNVAPTATLTNSGPASEGSPVTVSFTGQSDPSSADTAAGFRYAFSCTNGDLSGATYAGSSASSSTSCTFGDNGGYTVKARILDKDNGFTEYTTLVTVNNVAPTVNAGPDQTTNEGANTYITIGSYTDPGVNDGPWLRNIQWGDGTGYSSGSGSQGGGFGAYKTYADNCQPSNPSHTCDAQGRYVVTLRVTDKDGGVGSDSFAVTVNNVAPTITSVTNNGPVNEGASATITVVATDPAGANDPLSYEFDCDNSGSYEIGPQAGNSASCSFADNGVYQVNVRVTDDDGAVAIRSIFDAAGWTSSGSYTHWVTAPGVGVVQLNWSTPWTITNNERTYQTTAQDTATIPVNWQFQGHDDWWSAYHDAYVYADGPAGVTQVRISADGPRCNGCPFDYSLSGTTAIQVHQGYAFGVRILVTNTRGSRGTFTLTGGTLSTTVTVNNVAPVVNAGLDATVSEGSAFTTPAGPVGWWQAEGNANDSADGNNGSLQGATIVPGKTGQAFSVDGSTYVVVPDAANLRASSQLTMSAWIYPTGPGVGPFPEQGGIVLNKEGEYEFARYGDGTIRWAFANSSPGWVWINTGFIAPQGQWTHIAITYASGVVKTHANGSLVHTYTGSGVIGDVHPSMNELRLGGRQSAHQNLQGLIDEAIVYTRTLSAAEVATLYNSGPGLAFIDPGSDTWSATVDYGDGSGIQPLTLNRKTFALSHVYADNGVYTVTVTVTDDDGGVGSDTAVVTVSNVAPTVNAGADQTADEGSLVQLAPATFNDKGTKDTHTATINWGDGTATQAGAVSESPFGPPGSTAGASGTVSGSHVYADNGSYTVTVCVKDDDGAETCDTLTVTVNNVAPTVTATGSTINENGVATVSGAITDPGSQDTFTVVINWGEGAPQSYSYPAGSTSFSETHQYLDDNPTGTASDVYAISVTVTDDDTGVGSASTTVTVNNVAPTVNAGADAQLSSGQWLTVNAAFTDPGTKDTHAATVNWGDGSPVQSVAVVQGAGSGSLTATHRYFVPATYTVTVCVTDDDGGVHCDSLQLVVKRLVVAIDIKPGSFPNSINLKSKGNVPVGVLTGVYGGVVFDATTIDRSSLAFAGAPDLGIGKSPQDVDGDGDLDMVFHFGTQKLGLTGGSTSATLTGKTSGNIYFEASDSVRIVP